MNPVHVSESLLRAFVAGDLDDDAGVRVALHLDECPACATRAATSEPLAHAFATVPDPPTPQDLVPRVLAEASRAPRTLSPEVLVGTSLLTGAALLAVLTEAPLRGVVRLGVLLDALSHLGQRADIGDAILLVGLIAGLAATLLLGDRQRWFGGRIS